MAFDEINGPRQHLRIRRKSFPENDLRHRGWQLSLQFSAEFVFWPIGCAVATAWPAAVYDPGEAQFEPERSVAMSRYPCGTAFSEAHERASSPLPEDQPDDVGVCVVVAHVCPVFSIQSLLERAEPGFGSADFARPWVADGESVAGIGVDEAGC